jgi:hypothetical protein
MSESIRKRASVILDIYIAGGQWDYVFEQLNKEGKPTGPQQIKLILLLCKKVEELEQKVELLSTPKEATNVTPTTVA